MVARRQHAEPFVSDTKLRRQETADHSYVGNGTAARASFDWLMQHGMRSLFKDLSHAIHRFRLDQRVIERDASTTDSGCRL